MTPWVEGIDHVQLAMPAGGEDAARRFYGDLLGLPEVPKPMAARARGGCWFEAGALRLHLGVEADFRPARKAHPALVVSRMTELCERLQAAGVAVEPGAPLAGRARRFASDPFGNRLELIAATGDLLLRDERAQDAEALDTLHTAAFEGPAEAQLVARLRAADAIAVSLVAESAGDLLGHIVFSPLEVPGAPAPVAALAPMAVAPGHQRRGIGAALIRAGLTRCLDAGFGAVLVLGHPTYYPRFAFQPASRFALTCPYPAPDEAFLALELTPGALTGAKGPVHYHPAFEGL